MKVLLVNGSPHIDGCTNFALEVIASSLKEEGIDSEIFWIGDEPIGSFSLTHKYDENDIVNKFQKLASTADGFIFGCPVHYASAPGNFISFLDRAFCTNKEIDRYRLKPAAAICSARRGGLSSTFDELNKYFTISEMPIISSTYWNQIHGSNKEEAALDLEGVVTMKNLAKNMAYFLKLIDLGKSKVAKPVAIREKTNFIR